MLAVIGGGHFGSYHARQLLKAVRSGELPGERLLLVDRDPGCPAFVELGSAPEVELVTAEWLEFLRGWLPAAAAADHLIPAPLAPHLLWEWLAGELGASPLPAPRGWGLPYEVPVDGVVFLSAAAWICPATCVEPAHCPALHAPRDWDLAEMIEGEARRRGYEPAVFRCRHLAKGIASIGVGEVRGVRERLGRLPQARLLVGTSSHCHAAVAAIQNSSFLRGEA
jgi:hypothetical protein